MQHSQARPVFIQATSRITSSMRNVLPHIIHNIILTSSEELILYHEGGGL